MSSSMMSVAWTRDMLTASHTVVVVIITALAVIIPVVITTVLSMVLPMAVLVRTELDRTVTTMGRRAVAMAE